MDMGDNSAMDASIGYTDPVQAAAARSTALRWMLESDVVDDGSLSRQFGLTAQAVDAVRDGSPLLVESARAAQIDRLVAVQSLLLDGYSSARMADWFRAPMPGLDGLSARDLLTGDADGTPQVLEVAEAWMG
jgi:hypothetical protein